MDSDFPEFDEVYYKVLLPENPNRFDILAANANFNIYHSDLWNGTGKRFAEMIVQECVDMCDAYGMPDGTSPVARIISKVIKRKFGMDE